jgi:hypothetical protein
MSSGQLRRTRDNFQDMKVRGKRRRYQRGGVIPGPPVQITLPVTECVLHPGDRWRCARTDPEHLATLDHRLWESVPTLHSTLI